MATRSFLLRVVTRLFPVAAIASAAGCGADFDSPDKVDSLRVFAVQKDPPYAPPTTDLANPSVVNLSMLWTPGPHHTQSEVQRVWFSGCDDLPGDQYFTCLLYMHYMWKFYTWNDPNRPLPEEGKIWSPLDEPALMADYVGEIRDKFKDLLDALVAAAAQKGITLDRDTAVAGLLSTWRIGAGSTFQYQVTPGIIERHRPSTDPSIPNFGLSFMFFTACAGHIAPAPAWDNVDLSKLTDATLGFPFNCIDDTTGAQQGPEDFISGYTQQFVYGDGSTNNNPNIGATENTTSKTAAVFDGKDVNAAAYCIDGACNDSLTNGPANPPIDISSDVCKNDSALVYPHVKKCSGKCPTYDYVPTLDPAKNNDDTRFGSPKSTDGFKQEQMWINYYADKGSVKHTVRLLRDATEGWNAGKYDNTWTPPNEAGAVNFWSVVHDVRGGASWIRFLVCVDD